MKRIAALLMTGLMVIFLNGCEQAATEAAKLRKEAENVYGKASQELLDTKAKIEGTVNDVQEKAKQVQDAAKQAQEAADALKKLAE